MKVTIDVPAPSQLLELVSRLKQKNRNYKTQLKQLGRAHFITKRLLQDAQIRNLDLVERIGGLQAQLAKAQQTTLEPVRRQDAELIRTYGQPYPLPNLGKVDSEVSFDHPI